jgi:MFS family permease
MSAARAFLTRPPLRGAPLEAYRRERTWTLTVNVAYAMTAGGFVAVVADKVWAVHPAVIAAVTAAPMFSNLSGTLWSRLGHGRPKIPLITWMTAASLVFCGAIAFAPEGRWGAAVLVAGMALSNLLLSGIIALRSTVWSLNYDRAVRARVTGRFNLMTPATHQIAPLVGRAAMDLDPSSFRAIYLGSAVIGIAGTLAIARVPVVAEADHLALERGEHPDASDDGAHQSMLAVLREDRNYARYLGWQFLLGTSNMMIDAPLIYLVSNQLGAGYVVSIGLITVVPLAFATLTLPLWAHFLDRVHIVEFRVRSSLLWTGWQIAVCIGAWQESIGWILFGRILLGLARGGGSLAWNLGHNDFADQRNLAAYMGLHVTLTGLRGLFAPFLGMLLFVGWSQHSWLGFTLAGFAGIGSAAFLIPVLLSSLAGIGFLRLWREIQASPA